MLPPAVTEAIRSHNQGAFTSSSSSAPAAAASPGGAGGEGGAVARLPADALIAWSFDIVCMLQSDIVGFTK